MTTNNKTSPVVGTSRLYERLSGRQLIGGAIVIAAVAASAIVASRSAEHRAERVQACRHQPVPDPQPALLTLDQTGVEQDLHVVTDGRLRTTRHPGQITRAHLLATSRRYVAQQPQPDRIGQRGERVRQQYSLGLVEDIGADGTAAGDRIEGHGLTACHASTVSTMIEQVH